MPWPTPLRAHDIAASAIDPAAEDQGTAIETFVHRIDLDEGNLWINLDLASLQGDDTEGPVLAPPICVPLTVRQAGRNRPIVLVAGTGTPRRDADLIALVADARRWMDDLLEGRAASVAEITERDKVRPGTVSRILPLAWLAPDISSAILEGRQPVDLTARLLRDLPELPLDWADQRRVLGFPPA